MEMRVNFSEHSRLVLVVGLVELAHRLVDGLVLVSALVVMPMGPVRQPPGGQGAHLTDRGYIRC